MPGHQDLPARLQEVLEQLLGHAGAHAGRGDRGPDRVAHDHLAGVPLGELVHVGGGDMGAFAAMEREYRHLNEIMLDGIGGVDRERARIDHVLAVVQHRHLRAVFAAEHLREHLVEHLALRGRSRQRVDDDADAIRMLRLELLRDAQRPGVVRIDAEEEGDLRDLNTGEVALDHLPEHILLVPVGDEHGGPGQRAGPLVQPRIAEARDAHREKVDEGVVERGDRDEHAHQEQHDDQQVTQDRLVQNAFSSVFASKREQGGHKPQRWNIRIRVST